MRMWSKGLGKRELKMDCREYIVKKDPDNGSNVIILGKITDPVHWEFKITVEPEDIAGLMKLLFNYCVLKLTILNLFRYVLYLFNRQKYQVPENLEESVNNAYENMMNPSRPVRTRLRQQESSDEEEELES
ncbi:hypothetical protein WDW89_24050 [Deltaproteobacteria bacterium TL4]